MHLWVFNSAIRVLLLCPFWCTLNYYLNQCTIVERCLWVTIRYHRHLGFLWLEGGRNVRHPIRETSSDANPPGTRAHGRFGPLIHCGLIRRLKEWNWCARADLPFKKKEEKSTGEEWFGELSHVLLPLRKQPHKQDIWRVQWSQWALHDRRGRHWVCGLCARCFLFFFPVCNLTFNTRIKPQNNYFLYKRKMYFHNMVTLSEVLGLLWKNAPQKNETATKTNDWILTTALLRMKNLK